MTSATRTADHIAAHAVCAAAGFRDSLRAAQFYVRDLATADDMRGSRPARVPFVSRLVAQWARLADRLISWGANASIALLLPSWRQLPSPFTPGLMHEVAAGVRANSLMHNPLFNSYFYRAARHIAAHYAAPPYLILEHRVDAARRVLAERGDTDAPETVVLARILMALVEQRPITHATPAPGWPRAATDVDANILVNAVACVALLFAEEGRPSRAIDEEEFFAVTGALIGPRLKTIASLIDRADETALANELAAIRQMY